MSWVITPQQRIPAVIGEAWGGGYFAGYISHTADGNPTHALIVAPRATGATGTGYTVTTMLQWKTANTTTAGTTSTFDGAANTAAIVTAGIADHPAAQFCKNLNIGSFTDWYLPAQWELDIAYFNFKPGTGENDTSGGANPYSVPKRTAPYTLGYPPRTTLSLFNGGSESFPGAAFQWCSNEQSATNGALLYFANGGLTQIGKTTTTLGVVRAFRRIAL